MSHSIHKSQTEPNIIVFGGAFDPPHQGHVDCVRLALTRFPAAKIIVLPAAQPAGAAGTHKEPAGSFDDRLALCAAAFAAQDSAFGSHVKILPLEAEMPAPNFTVNTLRELSKQYPGQRLAFLLGQDQLATFHLWHEPQAILALADLIAVARGGFGFGGVPAGLQNQAEDLGIALGTPVQWDKSSNMPTAHLGSAKLYLIAGAISDAASSHIRSHYAKGDRPPIGWLTPAVMRYIREHNLYQSK